ncbi:MAG: FecR domain-containing protein [Bacteroidales bacterium]|nr:FecR domain-containing protein [Bacteroidales bacterium]
MDNLRFNDLLNRYLRDSLTEKELDELLGIIRGSKNSELLRQAADEAFRSREFSGLTDSENYDKLYSKLMVEARKRKHEPLRSNREEKSNPSLRISLFYRVAAAASVIILVALGILWISNERKVTNMPTVADLAPGGSRAMLTLGDGSTILLDSAGIGQLAEQAGTRVMKVDDGRLAYNSEGRRKAEIIYNTITTPRAGQYELILPDSSRVWLNSESSIRFPVFFSGSFRVVEITGEAYFEVAENREMPFRVSSGNTTVEVLGTSFNIRAYADEGSVNTTLIEGSVQVASPVYQTTIVPGQMAIADIAGNISVDDEADISEIIAWKKGLFVFNSESIGEIMNQIARWYDVDVKFSEKPGTETFSGIVSRKSNVSEVLKIMEQAGISFSITQEVITVEIK